MGRRNKHSLFADDRIDGIESPKESIKNKLSKLVYDLNHIYKANQYMIVYFYIHTQLVKFISNTLLCTVASQNIRFHVKDEKDDEKDVYI